MNRRILRSVCPYDCPDTCGLLVAVEGERVVQVSGDPEHPFTRGFLCPKMQHYERTVHSPRRLTTPLRRRGAKGSGDFQPITWDEAIERIAARWQSIIAAHGGEAILPYSYGGTMGLVQRNAGHPFFHALGASRLARTICSPAKGAGWQAIMGDTVVPPPDEVAQSDLVILWGVNAAATNIHYLPFVQQARRRGAPVWLIDTYRTPTAAGADRVMLLRPGSDGALALGMMHVLAREGLVDQPFVSAQVQGYEAFAAEVLPACTPIWASGRTGLPASLIEELARAYAGAQAPCIRLGSGLSRYGNGAMTMRTIAALPALVGAYGKIGGGCFPSTSTSAAFAAAELTREDLLAAPTRLINMNQLGHALTALQAPPIQSLYVYHANPAAVTPDQNAVLRGLSRDELFTVVHERFMTDTARYADIVLPATSSVEHSDLYRSYGTYFIQRARPCIPPVGESRSNREVFTLLARAMGLDEEIYRHSAEETIDHLLAIPSPLREGIDTAALQEGRAVHLRLPDDYRRRFLTPSGLIELYNPRESDPWPRYRPSYEEEGLYPLRLLTAPSLFGLNSTFGEQDALRRRQQDMRLRLHPDEAAARGLADGEKITAWNDLGEVVFFLQADDQVPPGVAVAEGVWWGEFAPGARTVNALTSQRLTDRGEGSTFYDNRIEVRRFTPGPS